MPKKVRGQRDEEAARRANDRFVGLLVESGVPRMPSRVFVALLFADEGAMTAAELAEALEVSPAAVSGAVRYLIQTQLVHREHISGTRKDRYRIPEGGWYETFADRGQVLRAFAAVSDGGAAALGGTATAAGTRMVEMRDFFLFLESELGDVMDRWTRLRAQRES